jgi:hypothetical protein
VSYFTVHVFGTAPKVLAANNGTWRGIQYVGHTEGDGVEMFKAVCKLGLEGIVSKKLNAPYKSGPSKAWLKIKNPKAPAATRATDGTFYFRRTHWRNRVLHQDRQTTTE